MNTPIRVLIVEDSPDDTALLLLELESGGYDPIFARIDTATAMKTAFAKQPWDIIIADYSMPHFNALAALLLLQVSGLDLPFIIVSGAIGEDTAVAAMKAGAHDYLMKDNLARLVPAVERELREAQVRRQRKVQALENSQLFSQVQRLQDQYRVVTESLNDAVYTVDLQERITFGNAALERLTGYRVQELVGHPSLELYTTGAVPAIMERQRRSGEPVPIHLEAEICRKDGTGVPVELSVANLILEGQMVGRVIVARDITERQYLEEQLRQSQKLEAVGELAAGVAHELGNALGIIGSSVQYLLKGCAEGHPFYEFLEAIHRNVAQADRTIRGLLSFARPRRPSPAPADITRLLEGTCQLLKGEVAKQHIRVVLRFSPDVPWVMADPEQLQQVFLNLLLNAVQAMPEGGVVTLTAMVDPEGKQVQIEVADTGLGIPQEHLSRIFDPFFTTKEEGTGLGLSVSARLIRAQGGHIAVSSREGKGSVFTIFLPAVAAGGAIP